ncbi:BQ5605_C002g01660 [Microbotryum silenes-dioicae]|uniref:BQ5605_C002g01660 protein n=1 Tax=Microbotryum silenes-dioicae TaxID=796604 RepID=A0A2X0M3S3_9BASI|nr:BQ5605_C002g01660 [Microbotryum silenes-dioicae]
MRSKIGDFPGFYLRASGWAFMGPLTARLRLLARFVCIRKAVRKRSYARMRPYAHLMHR